MDLLNALEERYGSLPSILATRADYTKNSRTREKLLRAAFNRAVQIHDFKNQLLIASSFSEHFAERKRSQLALKWQKVEREVAKRNFSSTKLLS